MKLFILTRIDDDVHYDEAYGFVVRAADRQEARVLASLQAGDEEADFWLNAACSKCDELTAEGEAGVILRDFNAG